MFNAAARVVSDARKVRPRSVGNTRWAPLAGRTREEHLKAGCHSVPQPAWSRHLSTSPTTSLSLWRRFTASSLFREPTTTSRTSLLTRYDRLHWRSMELITRRTQRSGAWFMQTVLNSSLRQSCAVSNKCDQRIRGLFKRYALYKFTFYLLILPKSNLFYTVFRKKHPLTFSFISPWMLCRFKQKLQWIYLRNGGFWQCTN